MTIIGILGKCFSWKKTKVTPEDDNEFTVDLVIQNTQTNFSYIIDKGYSKWNFNSAEDTITIRKIKQHGYRDESKHRKVQKYLEYLAEVIIRDDGEFLLNKLHDMSRKYPIKLHIPSNNWGNIDDQDRKPGNNFHSQLLKYVSAVQENVSVVEEDIGHREYAFLSWLEGVFCEISSFDEAHSYYALAEYDQVLSSTYQCLEPEFQEIMGHIFVEVDDVQ